MKLSGTNAVVITVAGAVIAAVAAEYPALRFRGDGDFSGGPLSGYRIQMRPIPFYQSGEYVFRFHGVPEELMSLQLYADDKGRESRGELINIQTRIEARLINQKGQLVCNASGIPPKEQHCEDCEVPGDKEESIEKQRQKYWVVMSGKEVSYWHHGCVFLSLNPADSYTLTLRVRDVDPRTPKIYLVPTLESGEPDTF